MQTSCMIIVGMMRLYTNMISGVLISIILLLFSVSIVAYMHVKFFNHGEPAVKKQYINISVPGTC